jgi:hypothetical protein
VGAAGKLERAQWGVKTTKAGEPVKKVKVVQSLQDYHMLVDINCSLIFI